MRLLYAFAFHFIHYALDTSYVCMYTIVREESPSVAVNLIKCSYVGKTLFSTRIKSVFFHVYKLLLKKEQCGSQTTESACPTCSLRSLLLSRREVFFSIFTGKVERLWRGRWKIYTRGWRAGNPRKTWRTLRRECWVSWRNECWSSTPLKTPVYPG